MTRAERKTMGQAGHAHATSRFAVARMARRTMDTYERVLARAGREVMGRGGAREKWS